MGWVIHCLTSMGRPSRFPIYREVSPNRWKQPELKVEQHFPDMIAQSIGFVCHLSYCQGVLWTLSVGKTFTQKSPNTCLVHWYPGIRIHPRCIYNSHLVEPFIWVNLQFHQPPKYLTSGRSWATAPRMPMTWASLVQHPVFSAKGGGCWGTPRKSTNN